jgi:phage shock protein A
MFIDGAKTMFKHILTLLRGRAYEAEQEFLDRNALPLLAQQMRDANQSIQMTRRAVAIAIAQNQQEEAQHKVLLAKIRDLEIRAIAALEQGKDNLARDAAETIALLEAECETSQTAQAQFGAEISKLQVMIRNSEARLRELARGERLVRATDSAQRINHAGAANGLSTIKDAEETLQRLRMRQQQMDLTSAALNAMDNPGDAASVIEKLAAAGCGAPLRSSADDVISRLRARMNNAA